MLEQVYELNLPSFDKISLNNFLEINQEKKYIYSTNFNFKEIIDFNKLPQLNDLNFRWNSYRYFKKSNIRGTIHTDLESDINGEIFECVWGINWVFGGDGTIEFWNFDNVIKTGTTLGAQNFPNLGVVPKFLGKSQANFKYKTLNNKVYLINATLPHRASGNSNRNVFSLRTDDFSIEWKDVVKKFEKLIIL